MTKLRLLEAEGGVTDEEVRRVVPSWQPGAFVQSYDPNRGLSSLRCTMEEAEAWEYENAGAALATWRAQDPLHPTRPDGRPNRPLTAFTMELS